mmetsp:Transcript_76429/g.236006  ORF Transcript_76429/g.236006 Transcript_76429/m.236006 type:complete len:275 (+) Transcript_76429:726-1550(+)
MEEYGRWQLVLLPACQPLERRAPAFGGVRDRGQASSEGVDWSWCCSLPLPSLLARAGGALRASCRALGAAARAAAGGGCARRPHPVPLADGVEVRGGELQRGPARYGPRNCRPRLRRVGGGRARRRPRGRQRRRAGGSARPSARRGGRRAAAAGTSGRGSRPRGPLAAGLQAAQRQAPHCLAKHGGVLRACAAQQRRRPARELEDAANAGGGAASPAPDPGQRTVDGPGNAMPPPASSQRPVLLPRSRSDARRAAGHPGLSAAHRRAPGRAPAL